MAEIPKKKRSRPSKVKENFPKLTPGQERAKKAWATRRSKVDVPPKAKEEIVMTSPGQDRAKKAWATRRSKTNVPQPGVTPQTDDITLEKIKSALENTKADIATAINKLSSMGLTVHKLGLKSTDTITKLSDITILLNL
jgi:hypothetical protein